MTRRQRRLVGVERVPLLISLVVAVAAGTWALASKVAPPTVTQPIAFNHQKHLAMGLSCDSCHQYAAQYGVAGLPKAEVCLGCHAAPLTDSPEEATVRAYEERGQQIPWVQVHTVPDHTYFSHRRHVTLGQLDCAVCHGDMTQQAAPLTKPAVRLTMAWCMDCHAQRRVTNDCNTCHK